MRLRRLAVTAAIGVVGALVVTPPASAVVPPLTLGAVSTLTSVPGTTAAFGNLTVAEDASGRLKVNDTLTFRFQDSGSASTIHFGTVGTVGGTNGLAGKAKISSSGGTLLDQMVVTITSASSGSFPGVLTLAGLNPALDANTATGLVKVTVNHVSTSGNQLTNALAPSDANIIGAATPKAVYKQQSTPPVEQTGTYQQIGNVVISEPTKSFFQAGDTITFTVRDAQGSTDTVGLASTPVAIGGSMQVSVHGASTASVQTNDTSFKVVVDAPDPSNGSTSAISVTNLYVNTAKAPLGPVTLTAVLTTGAATTYIVPGRVVVAGVGGVTSTTSNGTPSIATSGTGLPAGNVSVSAASGSLANGDQITLTIQEPGVTFSTGTKAPLATVTSGDLVLTSAQATLSPDANAVANKVATFSIKTGNSKAATIVIGPIFYDVAGGVAGDVVTLAAAGSPGSAFVPENVDNAVLAPTHTVATFTTSAAALTPLSGAPWTGADVTITPVSAGVFPTGSIYLLSPYASQIAAYRTTYASLPSVSGTGVGTPSLNSSAMVVQTAAGAVTAPAQTVLTIPVTSATGTVTVSGIVYTLGSYVPPGHLVGTGSVVATGAPAAADGEQYVDLSNAKGLGSVSSTTSVPTVYFTQTPPSTTTSTEATFLYYSDPTGANFSCVIDGVAIGPCNSGWTYTGFSSGTHTFTVLPSTDTASGQPATYTWTVDSTAPTATSTAPTAAGAGLSVTFTEPVLGAGTLTWLDTLTGQPVGGTLACKNGTTVVPCNGAGGVTSVTLVPSTPLVLGATYSVAVSYAPNLITDLAGTPMTAVTFTTRNALTAQENSPGVNAPWAKVATSAANGGSYGVAHKAGATTSFTFTGTSVAWYTVKGPSFGTANVYLDGVLKKGFNAYSSALGYNVVGYSVTGLPSTKHTLMIRANGAKGSSAGTDTRVAVDRFVAGATTTQQDGVGVTSAWQRVAASSAFLGGYALDDLGGASVTVPFRGSSITWYATAAPRMGRAYVYVDGALKATVDLYASSVVYKRLAYSLTGLSTTTTHTLKVVVVGTHRTGATGNNVSFDQVVTT